MFRFEKIEHHLQVLDWNYFPIAGHLPTPASDRRWCEDLSSVWLDESPWLSFCDAYLKKICRPLFFTGSKGRMEASFGKNIQLPFMFWLPHEWSWLRGLETETCLSMCRWGSKVFRSCPDFMVEFLLRPRVFFWHNPTIRVSSIGNCVTRDRWIVRNENSQTEGNNMSP